MREVVDLLGVGSDVLGVGGDVVGVGCNVLGVFGHLAGNTRKLVDNVHNRCRTKSNSHQGMAHFKGAQRTARTQTARVHLDLRAVSGGASESVALIAEPPMLAVRAVNTEHAAQSKQCRSTVALGAVV